VNMTTAQLDILIAEEEPKPPAIWRRTDKGNLYRWSGSKRLVVFRSGPWFGWGVYGAEGREVTSQRPYASEADAIASVEDSIIERSE
jgi:hypothetical protein